MYVINIIDKGNQDMKKVFDKNGLELSTKSGSGYKFVTIYNDKFIAFADVPEYLQEYRKINDNICDFYGFKNVVALGEFDDVRDAALVGQRFFGENIQERDKNLSSLMAGDRGVIPKANILWEYDRAEEYVQNAIEKKNKLQSNKGSLNIQTVLFEYYTINKDKFQNVTKNDIPEIRKDMIGYLEMSDKKNKTEFFKAAEYAFEKFVV